MAGISARRPGAPAGAPAGAVDVTPQVTETQTQPQMQAQAPGTPTPPAQTAPQAETPPVQQTPPAQTPPVQQAPAVVPPQSTSVAVKPDSVAGVNTGILENMDGVGETGNYVSVDGNNFLYKASNETATYIDIVIKAGRRYYLWVDETNPAAKQYHESDTKLDDRYKVKMDLRWDQEGTDGEPVEYIIALSTTSAIQFFDYVKKLAATGRNVGQVWTRMTISRHNRPNSTERYSRVDFEAYDFDGNALNIKSAK